MLIMLGLLLGTPIVLLIVLIPITIRAERARKDRIRQWAATYGWSFQERAGAAWTGRVPGHNRHGIGVTVTGRMGGRWVTVSEYSYETTSHSGDSTHTTTHHYIVALAMLDRPHPPLAVRHRGLMSQFGRALFGDKPTATGNVMFDARFRIDAADPAHAKAMVSPALMAAHIAGAVPQWSLYGNELLMYTPVSGRIQDPRQIPWYAGQISQVADLLGPVDFAPQLPAAPR
ncbi:hypothetical protein ACFXHA_26780 [Nocardia sp. NPDC059240]|uniref:hypothetical protein n=1 Tax=Nocardia sp. NPDC059240 TaxID=3346786 RepID=UPI0036B51B25